MTTCVRKIMLLLISSLVFLALSSCGKQNTVIPVDNDPLKNEVCKESRYFNPNTEIVALNGGYYATNLHHLEFIGKDGSVTLLCARPDCSHYRNSSNLVVSEDCDSFVLCMPCSVVASDNYVYILEYDDPDVYLVRISRDGSEHKRVMKVGSAPDMTSYFCYLFSDANTAYMVYNDPDSSRNGTTNSLDKLDILNGKSESVYNCKSTESEIYYLKFWKGKVYFLETYKTGDEYYRSLMAYDTESGETRDVLGKDVYSYTIADDGSIYYYIAGDGLYFRSADGKTEKKLRDSDSHSNIVDIAYDGTYIYMDNLGNRFFEGASDDEKNYHFIYVLSLNGELLNTLKAGHETAGIVDEETIYILDVWEDSLRWLYITGEDLLDPEATWTPTKPE